jgi:hypothetical protein
MLDPKALGAKSQHETNPAHVGALLKTGLALMGKESIEDPMEHWMCVPRPRLVQVCLGARGVEYVAEVPYDGQRCVG